jgi:hypothetical protein
MTHSELTFHRMASQSIGGQNRVLQLVRNMAAIQAQDYYGALWAIGLRTGLTEKEVIESIEKREIVRTWPQRGTLHFVPAENARWLVDMSGPRIIARAQKRHEDLKLDNDTLNMSKDILSKALRGGRSLTRPKMLELLEAEGISTKGGRGYHILWNAAQTGLIYLGPMEAKQQTFALIEDLQVKQEELSGEEAITKHVKYYINSHGPASMQDFMWWSGAKAVDAKKALETNESNLKSIIVEGKEYWMGKAKPDVSNLPEAILLPAFDEYIVGYKDRSAQMKHDYQKQVIAGRNGMFSPTVVLGGQVVGSWKRQIKKDHVIIQVTPFQKLALPAKNSIKVAAEKYGQFLGLVEKTDIT